MVRVYGYRAILTDSAADIEQDFADLKASARATCRRKFWAHLVTENPDVGATEVWEFYNATADAHPMHIHEVAFEVIDRQEIAVDEMNGTVHVIPGSPHFAPEPWETGRKDTVISYPGQVTRVKAKFGVPGQYVWHCNIVEHEDNEMMRPFRIGPEQKGQPMPNMDEQ